MSLDATVYCNCYETGNLLTQPPSPESIYVDEDGSLDCQNPEQFSEFYTWYKYHACSHERGKAVSYHIGNIALVAFLREELNEKAGDFLLILNKVIYNGIHAGDYINIEDVESMQAEVARLHTLHADNPEDEEFLRNFENQMKELVECSLKMRKPIVF